MAWDWKMRLDIVEWHIYELALWWRISVASWNTCVSFSNPIPLWDWQITQLGAASLRWCQSLLESIPDTPNLLPLSRSKVIEELKDQPNITVVYHYCDFQDTSSTSPTTLLRNILAQLLPVNGSWIPDFSDLVSRKDRREPPPAGLAQLCELIRRACKYHQHMTLAVDALDECKESREGKDNRSPYRSSRWNVRLFKYYQWSWYIW